MRVTRAAGRTYGRIAPTDAAPPIRMSLAVETAMLDLFLAGLALIACPSEPSPCSAVAAGADEAYGVAYWTARPDAAQRQALVLSRDGLAWLLTAQPETAVRQIPEPSVAPPPDAHQTVPSPMDGPLTFAVDAETGERLRRLFVEGAPAMDAQDWSPRGMVCVDGTWLEATAAGAPVDLAARRHQCSGTRTAIDAAARAMHALAVRLEPKLEGRLYGFAGAEADVLYPVPASNGAPR